MPDLRQYEARAPNKSNTSLHKNSRLQDLIEVLEKLPSWVPIGSGIIVALVSLWSLLEKNFEVAVVTFATILWLICLYVAAKRVESTVVVVGGKPRTISPFPAWKLFALFGVVLIPPLLILGGVIRIKTHFDASQAEINARCLLPQNLEAPRVDGFLVQVGSGDPIPIKVGTPVSVEEGSPVRIEATISGPKSFSCQWSTIKGDTSPDGICAVRYSLPLGATQSILNLQVRSECKQSTVKQLVFKKQ